MSRRIIQKSAIGNREIRVRYDSDLGEYAVEIWTSSGPYSPHIRNDSLTYFTDHRKDALDTARAMIEQESGK